MKPELTDKLRSLKGAPLSIIMALIFARQPLGTSDLVTFTGYKKDSVTEGLKVLEASGMVQRHARYSGWQLTARVRQMMLPGLMDQLEAQASDGDVIEIGKAEKSPSMTEKPPSPESETEEAAGKAEKSPSKAIKPPSQSLESLEVKDSLSRENLDSPPAEKLPSPFDQLNPSALLSAASKLFGKTIKGKPGDYSDPALLLAWIAHAWDTRGDGRGKTHSPAGLVYWAFHANTQKDELSEPDACYFERPQDFLPPEFIRSAGIDRLALNTTSESDPEPATSALIRESGAVLSTPQSVAEDLSDDGWLAVLLNRYPESDPLPPGSMIPERAWQAALGQLQIEMPRATFETYVKDATFIAYVRGEMIIGLPGEYACQWLAGRLSSLVTRLLTGIMNRTVSVRFVWPDPQEGEFHA